MSATKPTEKSQQLMTDSKFSIIYHLKKQPCTIACFLVKENIMLELPLYHHRTRSLKRILLTFYINNVQYVQFQPHFEVPCLVWSQKFTYLKTGYCLCRLYQFFTLNFERTHEGTNAFFGAKIVSIKEKQNIYFLKRIFFIAPRSQMSLILHSYQV